MLEKMRRLMVLLYQDEREALIALAEQERRDPQAQAAVIIRRELERRGLLLIETQDSDWRLGTTIKRLISNIPAACEILREHGKANLAFQLCQDQSNLAHWQEHGGLTPIVLAKKSETGESDE